jgi:hypothetical protein
VLARGGHDPLAAGLRQTLRQRAHFPNPACVQLQRCHMAFLFSPFLVSSSAALAVPSYRRRHGAVRPASRAPAAPPLALRVVHEREGARLKISGRLADVCAELDRLAAREARGAPC